MKNYLVIVPVADLRREPKAASYTYEKDPLQESQLLFNESVLGREEKPGWIRVEALEQKKWSSKGIWDNYPGWIESRQLQETTFFSMPNLVVNSYYATLYQEPDIHSATLITLSYGTRLVGEASSLGWWRIQLPRNRYGMLQHHECKLIHTSKEILRQRLLAEGEKFLGAPYLWGGRSSYRADWTATRTSVDCSGLVSLLYRVQGMDIPRDAHDQYLASQKRETNQLLAGDLIFMSSVEKPERMSHVMLYAGNGQILESTMQSQTVRYISVQERLGNSLEKMQNGSSDGKHHFFFGSLMNNA